MGSQVPRVQGLDELGQSENRAHSIQKTQSKKTPIASSIFIFIKFGSMPLDSPRCAAFKNGVESRVSISFEKIS